MKNKPAAERAREYLQSGGEAGMRSCWNCNEAHERLKTVEYPFVCFVCGHWFYDGEDITEAANNEA